MKVIVILLLMSITVCGQTSAALRQKYGKPKSETFEIRPDVDVTLTYGKAGNFCTATIEPTPVYLGAGILDEETNTLKAAVFDGIFDELFPKQKRGKLLDIQLEGRHKYTYENVFYFLAGGNDAFWRARILVRANACK